MFCTSGAGGGHADLAEEQARDQHACSRAEGDVLEGDLADEEAESEREEEDELRVLEQQFVDIDLHHLSVKGRPWGRRPGSCWPSER